MTQTNSLLPSLRGLLTGLPSRRRSQLVLLTVLMVIGAFAEVLSLGAIIPFLAILAEPTRALERPTVAGVVETLGLGASEDIRLKLTLIFAGTVVMAGIVRLVLVYAIAKLNFGI